MAIRIVLNLNTILSELSERERRRKLTVLAHDDVAGHDAM